MSIVTLPARLKDSYLISQRVKHFVCEMTKPINFLPGQFITIHFMHEEKALKRSYSIANSPHNDGTKIEFAASFVAGGPGTEYLYHLKPGDPMEISGPYGRLTLKEQTPRRYLLLATSTGITPYRSMLPELRRQLESHPNFEVIIAQGIQTRDQILYLDNFLEFAANTPRAKFFACLSREQAQESHEFSGHVQELLHTLQLNPNEDVVYLCGNPNMIDQAFTQLKEQHFPMQHIIREKYISR